MAKLVNETRNNEEYLIEKGDKTTIVGSYIYSDIYLQHGVDKCQFVITSHMDDDLKNGLEHIVHDIISLSTKIDTFVEQDGKKEKLTPQSPYRLKDGAKINVNGYELKYKI